MLNSMLGMHRVVNHRATDGIASGECWLYDEKGPSTVAALAHRLE
jgi:hypothetical protein